MHLLLFDLCKTMKQNRQHLSNKYSNFKQTHSVGTSVQKTKTIVRKQKQANKYVFITTISLKLKLINIPNKHAYKLLIN